MMLNIFRICVNSEYVCVLSLMYTTECSLGVVQVFLTSQNTTKHNDATQRLSNAFASLREYVTKSHNVRNASVRKGCKMPFPVFLSYTGTPSSERRSLQGFKTVRPTATDCQKMHEATLY